MDRFADIDAQTGARIPSIFAGGGLVLGCQHRLATLIAARSNAHTAISRSRSHQPLQAVAGSSIPNRYAPAKREWRQVWLGSVEIACLYVTR